MRSRPSVEQRCPCCSGASWGACCGRFLDQQLKAATPEALMRSRFSAFALGDADYLARTWHPTMRPRKIHLDPDLVWYQLNVLAAQGGPFDDKAMVEFIAYYRSPAGRGEIHERSRFQKVNGQWLYLQGLQIS